MYRIPVLLASTLATCSLFAAEANSPVLTVDEIVAKMAVSDRTRRDALPAYSSIRHYLVENQRFHVNAAMKVEVTVTAAGAKSFRILETSGPGPIRKLVFQRMLDTEARASTKDGQASTRISGENYKFQMIETSATVNGRSNYVLEAVPKQSNPLLFRGRIWVDAEDFAIVRIEGAPAQNPSFWVNKTRFVHEYGAVQGHWLAASNHSESDIKMFGQSVVTIRYGDYKIEGQPPVSASRLQ